MIIVADQNIPYIDEAFVSFGDVRKVPGREITPAVVQDADMLFVRTVTKVDEALLAGSRVRFVGSATIGFDHVDLPYLKSRNIGFSSAAGCNANSVGEYVTAALLHLAGKHGLELAGMTIGIIGAGNTGSSVAAKARALGMNVLLNDPPLARKTGIPEYCSLDEVLRDSDVLSFHVPLTHTGPDATFYMGSDRLFNTMKPGGFILNASRGPVIETDALLRSLDDGRIRGAVLDVWENEPDVPGPLLERVDLGTPHIAGYSRDGKANATRLIYEAACEFHGRKALWQPENLPRPKQPFIHIADKKSRELPPMELASGESVAIVEGGERKHQDILADLVRLAYDITGDDRRLRAILDMPAGLRGPWFERLRNEYPERREFHSITITGDQMDENLMNMLTGLGFCYEPAGMVSG